MAQIIVKKEPTKNWINIDSVVIENLPGNEIQTVMPMKVKKVKKQQIDSKKINKILLKIAKKSKYNNNYYHALTTFKTVKQKLVYRNYVAY